MKTHIIILVLMTFCLSMAGAQNLDSARTDSIPVIHIVKRIPLGNRVNFKLRSDTNQLRATPKVRVLVVPVWDMTGRSVAYSDMWHHDYHNALEHWIERRNTNRVKEHFEFFYAGCADPADAPFDVRLEIFITNFERHTGARRLMPNDFVGIDSDGNTHLGRVKYALDFTRFRLKSEIQVIDSRTCKLLSHSLVEVTHSEDDSRQLLSSVVEAIPSKYHLWKSTTARGEELALQGALNKLIGKAYNRFITMYVSSIITRRIALRGMSSIWE